MKTVKRIFFYLLLIFTILVVGLLVSAYLFKDQIINQFVEEANKSLNTPVTIGRIDVSPWEDFPNLAIVFHNVYVEDSHPGKDTLLAARKISFRLNPIEVWNGVYDVQGLSVEDSKTRLRINVANKSNYNILKENGSGGEAITFDLKNVRLKRTHVTYDDYASGQHHVFSSDDIQTSISIIGDLYKIDASGDVTTHQIGVGDQLFLVNKTFNAKADIDYDDENKIVTIHPSTLELNKSYFEIEGDYDFKEKIVINMKANGKDTDIQTIFTLLPETFSNRFRAYQSDGDVYFTLKVTGEISDNKSPLFSIAFGCSDATVFHPSYKSRITNANMEGSFATSSFSDLSKAKLFLKGVNGKLNGKEFQSNFSLQDFVNPYLRMDFKGELDIQDILVFFPIPQIENASGIIRADISFDGATGLLKKKSTAQKVKTKGTLDLKEVSFSIPARKVNVSQLSGSLQFNNNDLALSNTRGKIGKSDFLLNGLFKNSITFLLFENQPIGIEADLKSDYIDLDELFDVTFGNQKSGDYDFSISQNIYLNFNCNVKSLHYQRFHPTFIKGNLLIKNQTAVSRNLSLRTMGGTLSLDGIVDAKNPRAIDVVCGFKLSNVHIDSIFYVFENFRQDFILDKHLKGQVNADVNLEMMLNEKLHLFAETLVADIGATIRNGELNNFEPLKSLNKYLDDEGLSKLRFADLRNDIHIEKKKILIPQMEIRSNVTTIRLSGTHTFNQEIDYRVVAPLRSRKKIDPDAAFGAIEEDQSGQPKIFLKIIGTTDKYDVSYDKQALKQKISTDLKQEVKELRDAFKLKGQKKRKEAELSSEEFDWEDE